MNDDEFLRAHWIMYFKYSRQKGNDYIRFLLDEFFSPKGIFEKLDVSTSSIENVEELTDIEDVEEDEVTLDVVTKTVSRLALNEINKYVDSLKQASKFWYATFFPFESPSLLSSTDACLIDRLNRVKIGYFRPLVMSLLIKTDQDTEERKKLLKKIEQFIFVAFRISRFQSNYRSSSYYRLARSLYFNEVTVDAIIKELDDDLLPSINEDATFKFSYFRDFISKKFGPNGDGFYAWNDLTYFLYEYEESLKESRGQTRLSSWSNFIKNDGDKVSIEHIYPQTATDQYWLERFTDFTNEQLRYLRGSLGNLLPLSQSINSSLQNAAFDVKKELKLNDNGSVLRHGYVDGSYSEQEVARTSEWTANEIKVRGLKLLSYMEKRWNINFGTEQNKLEILHLSFLNQDNINEVKET